MEIEEMKEQMRTMMEQVSKKILEILEERRVREEERRREKEEKKWLEKRIGDFEWWNEKKERKKRKNNIVIKGIKWETENLGEKVRHYIKEDMKVEVDIKKATIIGKRDNRNIIVAEVDRWKQKRKIMEKNLGKGIWIKDDLTLKEIEIQQKLWDMARKEREKGDKRVKVGYKKIHLRGK